MRNAKRPKVIRQTLYYVLSGTHPRARERTSTRGDRREDARSKIFIRRYLDSVLLKYYLFKRLTVIRFTLL